MTKFIEITEANDKAMTNLVSLDNIDYFQSSDKGQKDTYVRLKSGRFFFIKETLEQVKALIYTDYNKPPVFMTSDEALKYYQVSGRIRRTPADIKSQEKHGFIA